MGWGSIKRYDEGTIASISGDSVDVDFAAQKGWSGKLSEFELVTAGTLTFTSWMICSLCSLHIHPH
jgi:hypothetical protein